LTSPLAKHLEHDHAKAPDVKFIRRLEYNGRSEISSLLALDDFSELNIASAQAIHLVDVLVKA
jgi:hypothetical protein